MVSRRGVVIRRYRRAGRCCHQCGTPHRGSQCPQCGSGKVSPTPAANPKPERLANTVVGEVNCSLGAIIGQTFQTILLQIVGPALERERAWVTNGVQKQRPLEQSADPTDFAGDVHEAMRTASCENLRAEVAANLAATMDRIQNGCYGVCKECGDIIELERLGALPTTPLCASCAGACLSVD